MSRSVTTLDGAVVGVGALFGSAGSGTLAAALVVDDEVPAHLSPEDVERLADSAGYFGQAAAAAESVAAGAGSSAGADS